MPVKPPIVAVAVALIVTSPTPAAPPAQQTETAARADVSGESREVRPSRLTADGSIGGLVWGELVPRGVAVPGMPERAARAATADRLAVFCNDDSPPIMAVPQTPPRGSICHQDIVRRALRFLRPWPHKVLIEHVRDPDDNGGLNYRTAAHFDDCNFDGGTALINSHYLGQGIADGALPSLSPMRRRLIEPFPPGLNQKDYPLIQRGLIAWASVLHAAQDFYAHSNWVEMTAPTSSRDDDLVDTRLGPWSVIPPNWRRVRGDLGDGNGDVLASQHDLPSGWTLRTPGHRFVPIVTDRAGRRHHVLVSGEAGSTEACPDGADFSHDEDLNKDDTEPPPRAVQTADLHRLAADAAIRQTQHEWCRLLHLAFGTNGAPGAAVLLGLLADPGRSPHPPDSRCAAAPAGPVRVTVEVTDIAILDDHEEDGPGQHTLVFTVFSEDMRRSRARQVDTVRVEARGRVPTAKLPPPITLCVRSSERLVATVQGWEDDGDTGRTELTSDDDLLNGVVHPLGPASRLAPQRPNTITRRSANRHAPDLAVSFRATAVRTPVAVRCAEEGVAPG